MLVNVLVLLALKLLACSTDLQFYSNKYGDLITFQNKMEIELKRIRSKIESTSDKVNKITATIITLEDYGFQYKRLKLLAYLKTNNAISR